MVRDKMSTLDTIRALGFNPVNTSACDLHRRLYCKECRLVFGTVHQAYSHKVMMGHNIEYLPSGVIRRRHFFR